VHAQLSGEADGRPSSAGDTGSAPAGPAGPSVTPARPALLKAVGVEKSFMLGGRKIHVLRGIDLELQAGDMAAVVGASGAGKSTLLHVLGTLDAPTAGKIFFEGVDLTRLSPARMAEFRNRSLGFVFQFHHLLPEFTALENVMMPALIQRVPEKEARRRALDLLKEVELQDRLAHRPGELSGGEQQRVALARALVMAPKLLLADEPTGNLDAKTGEGIHQLFYRMNRERGVTMLIVTHNQELARVLPRRLRMLDGSIVADTPEAAAAAPESAPAPTPGEGEGGGAIPHP
jgi:lipoprotein-releasing system ATP-binding protein